MERTINANTHAVIASGIQISSPVMKYFFKTSAISYWRRNYPFRPGKEADCRSWQRRAWRPRFP